MTTATVEHELAARAIRHLSEVLDSLDDTDLTRQSPCPDWKVNDVLAHLTGTADALADFVRTGRRELPEQLTPLADPVQDTRDAIRRVQAAIASDSTHAQRAAGDVAVEFTTHSWDLDPRVGIPEDLAADVHAFVAPALTDELRGQFFAPQLTAPGGATAGDRLLTFLGRDPTEGRPALREAAAPRS
ncbi:maleylpyruvate isomerase family mycothiol-dependent enzyme [Flexivirga sp. B27]